VPEVLLASQVRCVPYCDVQRKLSHLAFSDTASTNKAHRIRHPCAIALSPDGLIWKQTTIVALSLSLVFTGAEDNNTTNNIVISTVNNNTFCFATIDKVFIK
jgi:hypothetical protein